MLRNSSKPGLFEAAPPTRFREQGAPHDEVLRDVAALCAADHRYGDGTIFNSICSLPFPIAAEAFASYAGTNLGDNRIFPGLRQIEARVTRILGELLGCGDACGSVLSGGTEANLLAVHAALERFAARRRKRGRPQVLMPVSSHYSLAKIAALLRFEPVYARLDSRYRVDVDDLRRRITDRTALIVVTAGTSECGAVDDVPAIGEIALQAGIPVHVDAATGGFLIPFAREIGHDLPEFDLSVPGVSSITIDPHKYGCAPIPAGYLLFREREDFERLSFESHYEGTSRQASLLGTRSGAGVIAIYAALRHLGRAGYRDFVKGLFDLRDFFLRLLQTHGYELQFPPDLTIVGIRIGPASEALAHLEAQGVIASVSKRFRFLRVVVHRHLGSADLESFVNHLNDFRRAERRPSCGSCSSRSTS